MRSFGEILKTRRQKLGLTQNQVAKAANVSDAYICGLESQKRVPPPYDTVVAIANALQLDADRLWTLAASHRKKRAMEKSQRKTTPRRRNGETDDSLSPKEVAPDSQINAFFDRPEIKMAVLGLFQRQPKDMDMEEKRLVFEAINEAINKVQDFLQ